MNSDKCLARFGAKLWWGTVNGGEAFMLPAWTNFRLNTKAFPHLNRHDRHASNRSAGRAEWNLQHFWVENLLSDVETCSSMKVRRSYHLKVHEHFKVLTCWIVPRWSGRLERGDYVKGHDPEVSKAPLEDHVFMIWHHVPTRVCGLTRGHMERRRDLFQLDQP